MSQTTVTLAMMGIVGVVFLALHLLLRNVPWQDAAPRERWRWPVWSWYPLALGFGLLVGLAGNLYWIQRTPDHGNVAEEPSQESDIQPVRGDDAAGDTIREGTPTPAPAPTPASGERSNIRRLHVLLAQADVPVSGDAAAATPAGTPATSQPIGEDGPAWAEPGGTPIPDPFATPVATASPVASATPSATPSARPSPSPAPR